LDPDLGDNFTTWVIFSQTHLVALFSNEERNFFIQVYELDVNTCTVADTEFQSEFELTVASSGHLTAVAGYFDTWFDDKSLDNKAIIS
jgi:hypothetical protein